MQSALDFILAVDRSLRTLRPAAGAWSLRVYSPDPVRLAPAAGAGAVGKHPGHPARPAGSTIVFARLLAAPTPAAGAAAARRADAASTPSCASWSRRTELSSSQVAYHVHVHVD